MTMNQRVVKRTQDERRRICLSRRNDNSVAIGDYDLTTNTVVDRVRAFGTSSVPRRQHTASILPKKFGTRITEQNEVV